MFVSLFDSSSFGITNELNFMRFTFSLSCGLKNSFSLRSSVVVGICLSSLRLRFLFFLA